MQLKTTISAVALTLGLSSPAFADDFACKALMCFAGGMNVSECQPTISEVKRKLARGHSFPQCIFPSSSETKAKLDTELAKAVQLQPELAGVINDPQNQQQFNDLAIQSEKQTPVVRVQTYSKGNPTSRCTDESGQTTNAVIGRSRAWFCRTVGLSIDIKDANGNVSQTINREIYY